MQAHERVQDEELGLERSDGRGQGVAVGFDIEAHRGRGDDVDVQVGERAPGGGSNAGEPLPDDVERVLGGEEQDAAGLRRRKPTQARYAAGDRNGHGEREKRLADLGFSADDADGLVAPQLVDEPLAFLRALGKPMRRQGRQGHRRLPWFAVVGFIGGSTVVGVYVSKKSFSSSCLTSRCAPVTSRSFAIVMSVR